MNKNDIEVDKKLLNYPKVIDELATYYSRKDDTYNVIIKRLAKKLKKGYKVTVLLNGERTLLYLDKTGNIFSKKLSELK